MQREPYPLALSLAAALFTGLGLAAAALGIQWGAAPPPGDALAYAWLYVNILWAILWLVLWPAAALRPNSSHPLPWQWSAILVGTLPAVVLAAFVSAIPFDRVALLLTLQLATSLLVAGILRLRRRHPRPADILLTLLAAATLAGPVAAFLWAEFFPLAPRGWFHALPLLTIARAAQMAQTGFSASLWVIATIYATAGVFFLLTAHAGKAHEKAPGTRIPGA